MTVTGKTVVQEYLLYQEDTGIIFKNGHQEAMSGCEQAPL